MLLVLRDRRFDVTRRALVVGALDGPDDTTLEALVEAGVDAIAVRTSSARVEVCDRVGVPVGVVVTPGRVEFESLVPITAAGPFDGPGPARIAAVAGAIQRGERLILSPTVDTVRADRRVVEVMVRILAAREATA